MSVVELKEYESLYLPNNAIEATVGERLWTDYRARIEVEPPSFKTGDKWRLRAKGHIGYIPASPDLGIFIKPRVELGNLFRMLEYAYQLELDVESGVFDVASIREFYERLASLLSRRILIRLQRGILRSYDTRIAATPFVRGRIALERQFSRPWRVGQDCRFDIHTADIIENRLLAWTLFTILRSGACSERSEPEVRRAFHGLSGAVTLEPYEPDDCTSLTYTRLNEDYRQLHTLCRFFLDSAGPRLERGNAPMLPFLIDMAALFQDFVAAWLRSKLPHEYRLGVQETVLVSEEHGIDFVVDLVIFDRASGTALCVLDTKYKLDDVPQTRDIQQIAAYALAQECSRGVLVYPRSGIVPFRTSVGHVTVRSAFFGLDGNLEDQGAVFLDNIIAFIERGNKGQSTVAFVEARMRHSDETLP